MRMQERKSRAKERIQSQLPYLEIKQAVIGIGEKLLRRWDVVIGCLELDAKLRNLGLDMLIHAFLED